MMTWYGNISPLVALCEGNPPATDAFPSQRPVTRSFDVFFYLHLNTRLIKQSKIWVFETLSYSSWRYCNVRKDKVRLHVTPTRHKCDHCPLLFLNVLKFVLESMLDKCQKVIGITGMFRGNDFMPLGHWDQLIAWFDRTCIRYDWLANVYYLSKRPSIIQIMHDKPSSETNIGVSNYRVQ